LNLNPSRPENYAKRLLAQADRVHRWAREAAERGDHQRARELRVEFDRIYYELEGIDVTNPETIQS
jgi:hypothetical protein